MENIVAPQPASSIKLRAVPRPYPANLVTQFELTTDSVVATLILRVTANTRFFRMDWGDGSFTAVNPQTSIELNREAAYTSLLPDGSYRLQHPYAEPADKEAFQHTVFFRAYDGNGNDDLRVQNITLTPTYLVSHGNISMQLMDEVDAAQVISEWDISYTQVRLENGVGSTVLNSKAWEMDIAEAIIPTPLILLPDTRLSGQINRQQSLNTYFQFIDDDWDLIGDSYYSHQIILNTDIQPGFQEKTNGPVRISYFQQIRLKKELFNTTRPILEV
ncbi:MAG: hypothetical protein QM664_12185 [Flavihumibacter sp.]